MNKVFYIVFVAAGLTLAACNPIRVTDPQPVDELPEIYPDYVGVTIPVNIAPMAFDMKAEGYEAMDVLFRGKNGEELEATGTAGIDIDLAGWRRLLAANSNDSIEVTVRAKCDGKWLQYRPFAMYVKPDSIDYGITYRLIAPGYQVYSKMGIYQRRLSDYKQKPLFENTQVTDACVNCHTFSQGNPDVQSVHIRGAHGGTVIVKGDKFTTYNTRTDSTLSTAAYPYWHPQGRYIAYSTNLVNQIFHTTETDLIETYDKDSDLYVMDTETGEIIYSSATKHPDYFETNAAFSADGKRLYFCRAKRIDMPAEVKEARYDLCAVDFDPETGVLGTKVDTLVMVTDQQQSISLPRPTSDGRYIVYAQTNYSCFPLYHQESDLHILDLATGETRRMEEVNSNRADAFHNWSSNNRWLVIGSRRADKMHTLLYFAYVDENGVGRKPFLLPQPEPKEYYANQMMSYNCPEFVRGEVMFDARQVGLRLEAGRNEQLKVRKQP